MPRAKLPAIPKQTVAEAEALEFWKTHPVDAVKSWFGVTPDDWQGDTLNELLGENAKDRAAVKSAHGPGKTAIEAWSGWIFLRTRKDSRVVATAPTMSQLVDVLWPEYAKWHARMIESCQSEWIISASHIRSKARPKTWFAVSRTSNKAANLQGFHNTDLFIQCDEASGVPPEVFEVIEGALSEAGTDGKTAKLLIAGNPNFTTGELYDAFTKNKALYSRYTITGDPTLLPALHVDQGQHHPAHGKMFYSPRVKMKYVNTIYTKYGADSAIADVRVRGVFPRHDDRSVIPFEWAERARGGALPTFDRVADQVTIVLDPARYGGNETVVGVFRRGICIQPLKCKPMTSLQARCDMVQDELRIWKARGIGVERVIVDEPGIGGDTIDELERRGIAVIPYHGGRPLVEGVDPLDEIRTFHNRRARDWWHLRRLLELREIPLPDDEVLVAQLASLHFRYMENTQKIIMESKKEFIDRPTDAEALDRADVIVMGSAPYRSTNAINSGIIDMDVEFGDDRPHDDLITRGSYHTGVLR